MKVKPFRTNHHNVFRLRIIHAGGEEMVDKIRDYVSKVFGPHVILSSGYGQTGLHLIHITKLII